jgi:bifunctional NMN adenylyltransferase/nudix hydrolase
MTKKYGTMVFIGRFQPLHTAHAEIIRRAAAMSEQLVIIVGSANQPRTYKNPFTSTERNELIRQTVASMRSNGVIDDCRIYVEHNIDTIYNDQAWAVRVQGIVSKYRILGTKTGIIGHDKDDSTFYLKMFPQWDQVSVELIEPLHATDVRDLYFRDDVNFNFLRNVVPETTMRFLQEFRQRSEFNDIIAEREFVAKYRRPFAALPYEPVFVTADAVVIQSGHVLMVRRRGYPGRGLWALPGGFLNAKNDRSMEDCALRELREETGLKVPVPVLRGNIKYNHVFDAIDRSSRGRTITHAFKIVLPDGELPKVKGQDDAEKAVWRPISEVNSEFCFEDHFEIIQYMLGV